MDKHLHRFHIDRLIQQPLAAKPDVTLNFSKELRELLTEVEKMPGTEVVPATAILPFNVTPSGIFQLDLALGGGWAEGFPSTIYGYGNAGKTTTMLRTIAAIQRKYPYHKVLLCDVETTFDPEWADKLGVDRSRLLILRPSGAEAAGDVMLGFSKLPEIAAIFLDSIPVLVPSKDFDDSLSDVVIGTRARAMGRFSSNLLQSTLIEGQKVSDLNPNGHRFSFFASNSWRNKIGVMFGSPATLPGGEWQHTFFRTKINLRAKEINNSNGPGGKEVPLSGRGGSGEDAKDASKKAKGKGTAVSHTEHEFSVDKAKFPGTRQGEFKMNLDPVSHLAIGAVDDVAPLGAWAKRLGILRQSGTLLVSDLFDYRIDGRAELEQKIYTDREFREWLELSVQIKNRIFLKLPPLPPDGYLVAPAVSGVEEPEPAPVKAPITFRRPGTPPPPAAAPAGPIVRKPAVLFRKPGPLLATA